MKKGIISNLLPDYCFNSLAEINSALFFDTDLVIFDLDNTLVFPETCVSNAQTLEGFRKIARGNKCIILSNSKTAKKRKNEVERLFGCKLFLSENRKPFYPLFKEIEDEYELKNKKIIMIGDRILIDILFGNLNNALTILIKPMTVEKDFLGRAKRFFDNFLYYILDLLFINVR